MTSDKDGKSTPRNELKICIDTSIFINAKNEWEAGSQSSRDLLKSIRDGKTVGVISIITLAELLNGAYRMRVKEAERLKADFRDFESAGSLIVDLDFPLADKIGELCAKHNTRIRPDVIVVAPALMVGAGVVATRDIEHFKSYRQEIWIAEPEEILPELLKP